jgi:hypothetical protein
MEPQNSPFLPVGEELPRAQYGPIRIQPAADARQFTPMRRAQGFRDQAHLDAWYLAYDHAKACPECGLPGPAGETTDGGWQPSETRCAEWHRLSNAAASPF